MEAARQTYPEYKNTAIPGFPSLPKHWQVARLKHLCDYHSLYGANIPASEYRDTGVRFLRTTDITDEGLLTDEGVYLPTQAVAEYILGDGDILLSRSGTVGRSFLYRHKIHGPCAYAGYLVRFVPKSHPLANYIHLFTKTTAFTEFIRTSAISSTIDNVNAEKYANCRLPLPPPDEQADIVRYLDHADELISRYISAKQRLIALLEEQRQAVIHQAVTRGLDPNEPLKDSGFHWPCAVPQHWQLQRLKTLCSMKSGDGITTESIEPEGPYPVYGGNGIRGYSRSYTHEGQFVLIGRQGALCGNIHRASGKFWASEHAVVASLHTGHSLDWFAPLLEAMNLNQYSIAAAQPGLSVERVMNLSVPVPPPYEQEKIGKQINQANAKTGSAIEQVHRQIDLTNEYRTRLIADVVTGQIDVRDAVIELPGQHL